MLNFFENLPETNYPFVHKRIFLRLQDNFHQVAFGEIQQDTSKLRTYAILKREAGFENYLNDIKNVSDRILVSKFRLSNHRLMIEVGRHEKIPIPREQRFCPFCPGAVEDELHFTFSCPTYKHLRIAYLDNFFTLIPHLRFLPHDAKFHALFSNPNTESCKFIASSMELRQFLTSNPKSND